jgi:putative MATE family efflux protein
MYSLLIGNLFNILLDPILIFGWWIFPEMGLTGAAVASVIGRGIGVLFQIYFLQAKSSKIRLRANNLTLKPKVISELLRIGSAGMFQYFLSSVSWIILIRIVSTLGQGAVAAYTIVIRIIIFCLMPSWGVANAAATLVGQNLGAGKPDRAEKSVWRAAHFNAIYLGFVSIAYLFLAKPMAAVFSMDDQVLVNAAWGLQIIAAGNIFYGYGMIMSQSFNGAGDTRTPMILNAICFIGVQAPLAWILVNVFDRGQEGTYIAVAVSYTLMAILAMILFRKGNWKKVVV